MAGAGYLDKLNAEQRAAAEYGVGAGDPPLLIIAGAGSGKTATLAHRVAHLLVSGADPRRILLMTFSRRAAAELTRRVERITAQAMGSAVAAEALTWAGTFHAVGARILREHALSIGLSPEFSIHDREDSADLMNLCRHGAGLSKTEARFPTKSTCLAIYSRAVNAEEPLAVVLRDHFPWVAQWEAALKQLFRAYVAAKQAQNVLDYDDLLLAWAQVMSDEGFAAHIGAGWDHVLIDEYQDTNRLQARILTALKPDGRGLTVVGDDAQSIYAFRAATVRNILDFPGIFGPRAEVITLERNYRSTRPILDAANAVIGLARERYTKNLWTERVSERLPRLVMPSSRGLPPVVAWRGTRPSQAARSRPRANVPASPTAATSAVALSAPTPGMVSKRRACRSCSAASANSRSKAAIRSLSDCQRARISLTSIAMRVLSAGSGPSSSSSRAAASLARP